MHRHEEGLVAGGDTLGREEGLVADGDALGHYGRVVVEAVGRTSGKKEVYSVGTGTPDQTNGDFERVYDAVGTETAAELLQAHPREDFSILDVQEWVERRCGENASLRLLIGLAGTYASGC